MKHQEIITKHNPSQSVWEMNELIEDVDRIHPRRILEIGTHRGRSLRVWKEAFDPFLLIGVNLGDEMENKEGVIFIDGKSQDPEIIAKVRYHLNPPLEEGGANMDIRFDFVFLDGSHMYDDVKADFYNYLPMVREGGIIALHDIVLQGNDTVEVYKFWEEIKRAYRTKTLWDGSSGTGTGIVYI